MSEHENVIVTRRTKTLEANILIILKELGYHAKPCTRSCTAPIVYEEVLREGEAKVVLGQVSPAIVGVA
jgi:hypothetical protein